SDAPHARRDPAAGALRARVREPPASRAGVARGQTASAGSSPIDLREDVVNAELVSELEVPRHRTLQARAVGSLGPLAVLGGVIWALAQPYRVTLLHPHGQGFWWLFVEPPLLVVLVGLVFWFAVAPGLLEDLEE